MTELQDAYSDLREDIFLEAEARGIFQEEAFFELYAESASENGDTIDLEYTHCRKEGGSKPYRVDGYAYDEDRGILHLAICDYRSGVEVDTLYADRLDSFLKQAINFFENSLSSAFINSIEDSSPAFSAAYPVYMNRESIRRVRVILFSNARLAAKRPPQLAEKVGGLPIVYSVLDISRYYEIQKSRSAPESIEVDLKTVTGGPLPCLRASVDPEEHESYLLAISGSALAEIYGLFGARLLEQNVRTYLQARTKVNRGIINTIREEPEKFFAYNNGLTATASAVSLEQSAAGQLGIATITDLQIVNGGQTTASILYAKDVARVSLEKVHVQMKLSVIPSGLVEKVVPKISRFANTQNRISEADFFSSHPFHLQMERYSRLLTAPPQQGALAGDKWFYERARGQYKDGMAYATPAEKHRYQLEFPRQKVIVKTDLAKYVLTFECKPHLVSKGAQKCFMAFAEEVAKTWRSSQTLFNEYWYRNACSMALLFRWTDKMIAQADWYAADRGYKSQTVTYTLALLSEKIVELGKSSLDWSQIWNSQDVPEEIQKFIIRLAPQVASALRNTPDHIRNVGEYCKKDDCWNSLLKMELDISPLPEHLLLAKDDAKEEKKAARATSRIDFDIDFDVLLLSLVPKADVILATAEHRNLLSPKNSAALRKLQLGNLSLVRSEKNALKLLIQRLAESGVPIEDI